MSGDKTNWQKAWEIRVSVAWFILFSINSLGTCVLAASAGCVWSALGWQEKFTICVAIIVNWTGCVMAYLKQAAKKIESGQFPINDDTQRFTNPNPPANPASPKV